MDAETKHQVFAVIGTAVKLQNQETSRKWYIVMKSEQVAQICIKIMYPPQVTSSSIEELGEVVDPEVN